MTPPAPRRTKVKKLLVLTSMTMIVLVVVMAVVGILILLCNTPSDVGNSLLSRQIMQQQNDHHSSDLQMLRHHHQQQQQTTTMHRRNLWSVFPSHIIKFQWMDPKSVALKKTTTSTRTTTKDWYDEQISKVEMADAQSNLNREADEMAARGETAFYVIPDSEVNNDLFLDPSRIFIKVINPKPRCMYSVTIVSYNRYTGTALLLPQSQPPLGQTAGGEESQSQQQQLLWKFMWKPSLPGKYDVLVHELNEDEASMESKVGTPLIQSSFPFFVSEGVQQQQQQQQQTGLDSMSLVEDRIRNNPPCSQQQQQLPNTIYSQWEGTWLGPEHPLLDNNQHLRLRTGWTFLPSDPMNCNIETYSPEDLRRIPKKTKIYIFGSSIMRGVFLSLVDLMLSPEEKGELERSIIAKCWGRATVQSGNLELMYQDFRSKQFEDPSEPLSITCHNEKLAKHPGSSFIQNATAVWEEIFTQNDSEWPSVILSLGGNFGRFSFRDTRMRHNPQHEPMWQSHVRWFVHNLPPTWRGTLIFGDDSFNARVAGLADMAEYKSYLEEIKYLLNDLNDSRVRWIDGHGLSKEMRMYGENGENHIGQSQHFHSYCNDDANIHGTMTVCSNVTELVGQVLLGHALGPKKEFMMRAANDNPKRKKKKPWAKNTHNTETKWCHACPKCLVPSKIIPYPEMACGYGALEAKSIHDKCDSVPEDVKPRCPQSCLDTRFRRKFRTESDTVYVRHCPLSEL